MSETVVIIESPNKVEKVKKYSGFETYATIGHFMNLISFDQAYNPKFDYDQKKKKNIFYYIERCKNKIVYVTTDPDREGYAIGKMFFEKIKKVAKEVYRAEFHEITANGIQKGIKEAKPFVNTNLSYYDSFLGRRVGDRLIGYSLSPYLSNSLNIAGMSAGRVQTPALSIIVDREREIEKFENLPKEQKVSYQLEAIGLLRDGQEFILKSTSKYNTRQEAEFYHRRIIERVFGMSFMVMG